MRLDLGLNLGIYNRLKQSSLVLDSLSGLSSVAYSLRKLKSTYTGSAIRVRRSSDNAEQDIGFSGTDLDTTALLAFCGAGNGFVTTWYDQSGNGYNATQITAANQPQIVASGVVITDNGKPAITFDGVNDTLTQSTNMTTSMVTAVFNWESVTGYESSVGGTGKHIFILDGSQYRLYTSAASLFTSPASNYWVNGVNTLTTGNGQKLTTAGSNSVTTALSLGRDSGGGTFSGCKMQEVIAYTNTSDRTTIESDINTHYGIY